MSSTNSLLQENLIVQILLGVLPFSLRIRIERVDIWLHVFRGPFPCRLSGRVSKPLHQPLILPRPAQHKMPASNDLLYNESRRKLASWSSTVLILDRLDWV